MHSTIKNNKGAIDWLNILHCLIPILNKELLKPKLLMPMRKGFVVADVD